MDALRDAVGVLSVFVLPALLVGIPLYGLTRRVPVYEAFVAGGREGFDVAVRIIPYLVAILFAIAMFRASGAMEALATLLGPVLALIGMPVEVLPMAIVRPLTGSGSAALVADLAATHGADSLVARMGATMFGSTETTFYVLAVYFGAVGVSRTRHAVPAGLIADISAMLVAVWVCRPLFT
jgi:spore maturation protein B